MEIQTKLKKEILSLIQEQTGVLLDESDIVTPPDPKMGDMAVPLFKVAQEKKDNPVQLATTLASSLSSKYFDSIESAGPYLNFFLNTGLVAQELLEGINKKKDSIAKFGTHKKEKIMIEYFSPNTNKAMSIGHVRNLVFASSIANLFERAGAEVLRTTLFNDRGIAIAKSMVAYDLYGDDKTPESEDMKPDQFVGYYYTLFSKKVDDDPKLDQMAKEYLQLWEQGDKKIHKLWKKMNTWVYKGFEETLEKLNENFFDVMYYESQFYDKAKEVVEDNVGEGVLKRGDEGEIYADLEEQDLPNKIVLRSDGTSLYITQDIYLAKLKDQQNIDRSIYVTGDEQNMQFKQLFAILESLEDEEGKYEHLSYGMMRLPEGKIKSREGLGKALADALIDEVEALARLEIAKRQEHLKEKEIAKISNQLMQAAIKFYILNVDPKKVMIFDPKEAVSFTGKTGPYLQYTIVRLNSILHEVKLPKNPEYVLLDHDLENQLINKLKDYEGVVEKSLEQYAPSILTQYLYELAQLINHYYHEVPILKAPDNIRDARLGLLAALVKVLSDGLEICNIPVPEKM